MPLAARGHRLGETLGQPVGLRAITDEWRERSPFFFDRNQLLADILAVERLDPLAEGSPGGESFGPYPGSKDPAGITG